MLDAVLAICLFILIMRIDDLKDRIRHLEDEVEDLEDQIDANTASLVSTKESS